MLTNFFEKMKGVNHYEEKVFLSIFVVIILLINDSRVYASSQSTCLSEDMRQARIEQIFSEINMLFSRH